MKEIKINIDDKGNITMDLKGFKGKECVKTTEELEKALGKVTDKKLKSEGYEEPVVYTATVSNGTG